MLSGEQRYRDKRKAEQEEQRLRSAAQERLLFAFAVLVVGAIVISIFLNAFS